MTRRKDGRPRSVPLYPGHETHELRGGAIDDSEYEKSAEGVRARLNERLRTDHVNGGS